MLKKIILATALVVGSVFAQNIHVGAHAAGNIGTAWGDNTDEIELGWGPGFNAGVDAKFVVNPQFSVLAGIGVDYRRIPWDYGAFLKNLIGPYMTSEYGYSSQYDAQLQMMFSVKATYSFMYLDIPVIARINMNPNFFFDAGIDLGINIIASVSAEVMGVEDSEDIESEMVSTIDFGLVAGLGYSITDKFDVYFRAVFGLTNMIDFEKAASDGPGTSSNNFGDDDDEDEEGDFSPNFDFKNMRFQLGVSYWFM